MVIVEQSKPLFFRFSPDFLASDSTLKLSRYFGLAVGVGARVDRVLQNSYHQLVGGAFPYGEYLLRLAVAEPRGQFVRSFFGLLDLVAILPFYLAVGVDLRAVRTFRLLRLIRILKLARYSAAIRRLHRAAIIVREELVLFLNVALILIFLVLLSSSVGKMTLRLYSALSYSQNSARDLRCALYGA